MGRGFSSTSYQQDNMACVHQPIFLAGIVEGFYGRPWRQDKRKSLFRRMADFGLNSYMYAPKDDLKHRAYWRELYSAAECHQLRNLIAEAENHGVQFFYAVSPGLDMVYSSVRDRGLLRAKFEQVASLGCKSFAILFDDIEPQLSLADRPVYKSFAEAHVAVANEIYDILNRPKFLFCPTEYCGSRSVPSVRDSEYLKCIGNTLVPAIEFMWTGPQVISKVISVDSLAELSSVIQRRPVIWDNLHANDYDQRRLFLGPYNRDVGILSRINGIFTNPNCELEANFSAFYTMGLWVKNGGNSGTSYEPRTALAESIREWLKEFNISQRDDADELRPVLPLSMPSAVAASKSSDIELVNTVVKEILTEKIPTWTGEPSGHGYKSASEGLDVEPMDLTTSKLENKSDGDIAEDTIMHSTGDIDDNLLFLTTVAPGPVTLEQFRESLRETTTDEEMRAFDSNRITEEDLSLLTDLFYLPFEHGQQAISLLEDFRWLRRNAALLVEEKRQYCRKKGINKEGSEFMQDWNSKANTFEERYNKISRMCIRISNSVNRTLVYEIFPYFWDLKGILSLLNSFVKWIASTPAYGTNPFLEENQELWVQHGGLFADFQRLLPLDTYSSDLFATMPPQEIPTTKVYTIRPFALVDQKEVYEICRKTYIGGTDDVAICALYPDLIGDCIIGGFLTLNSEFCFVVEDDAGAICGYITCTPNARTFRRQLEVAWREEMQKKYPLFALGDAEDDMSPVHELIHSIHFPEPELDERVYRKYPGLIRMNLLKTVSDQNVAKRMLACALSALKINNVSGVHVPVNGRDPQMRRFFDNLGFSDLCAEQQVLKSSVVMTRSM